MRPILLPFLERRVRKLLTGRGIQSRTVPSPAGPVHVYDAPGTGTLPCIVVLHGLAASGTGFAAVLARLRPHAKRVIVPDHPGHGFNADPTVRLTPEVLLDAMTVALDDVLGDEPFIVVGNSLGGVVALHYAKERSERCRALVLVSPAGAANTPEEWTELRGSFGGVTSRKAALAFTERIYHRPPFLARMIAHELPANLRRRAVSELLDSVTSQDAVPVDAIAGLKMPILFLWGRSERLLPPSHLAWWQKHLPAHAVIEEPEGMGHCPHFDAPGRLARRIVDFAKSTS